MTKKSKSSLGNSFRKIKRLRLHHKIIFSLIGIVGIILVWRGVWTFFDNTPFLNDPVVSIIVGFLLVGFSGLFFKLL
jgi:K+-transporting ATPase A subunit